MKASQLLNELLPCGLQKFDSRILKSENPLSTRQNLINYFRDLRVMSLMLLVGNTAKHE